MKKQKWTTANIPDLTEKVIIVTGGNSGLGYESVKAFAEKGAEVILTSRSVKKGEAAKKEIGKVKGKIEVMQLDLQDFASIEQFAEQFQQKHSRLDVLLNNAGIMQTPYFKTKDGLEGQMGVNHFGHYKLTGLLMDLIKTTPKSRVVSMSSAGHKYKQAKMDFDNLLFENGKDYTPMKGYCRSKLANLLFIYELDRMFKENNIDSIAVAAHPGGANTNLGQHVEDKLMWKIMLRFFSFLVQEPPQGALPEIRACVDENVNGAEYYGPDGLMEMKGNPEIVKSSKDSHNKEYARKLWEISEKLTGINYL
ncbi:MAG: SDR family NAD(P)-dependent oxidoreductase [Candidatus Cloacimonetes bacterium]|nr:SDR family NAD(P)-dependent oxidoreductase [Candidatus Cloacimonadota bacterium]